MSEQPALPIAPPEPIFNLDLGANGGFAAPKTLDELKGWISQERAFWQWLPSESYTQGYQDAFRQLQIAATSAQRALELELQANQPGEVSRQIEQARAAIADVYGIKMLAHSSTPVAKKVEAMRFAHNEIYASFFAAVYLPPSQGHTVQPQTQHGLNGSRLHFLTILVGCLSE